MKGIFPSVLGGSGLKREIGIRMPIIEIAPLSNLIEFEEDLLVKPGESRDIGIFLIPL